MKVSSNLIGGVSKYFVDSRGLPFRYHNSDELGELISYDEIGNILTYEDSGGFSGKYTRDSEGNELTYEDSNGVRRGFDIPEYTMEELIEKLGNFRLVTKN